MNVCKLFILTFFALTITSCEDENKDASEIFSTEIINEKKIYKIDDTLSVQLSVSKDIEINSIKYSLDGAEYESDTPSGTIKIPLRDKKLGKRNILTTVISDKKNYSVTKEVTIVAAQTPELYGYRILESYPHDMTAYTQGLEFKNDTLYESTGKKKMSSLRKTDYKTGEVIKKVALPDQFFGEGLTILNDKIYQLTWQAQTGFIYNANTLEKTGTFVYGNSKEGWGLCNDGNKIYKSDGTEKIWTLNAENLSEEDYIEIYTNKSKIDSVNELEFVDGKIYANIYQKDAIAIVNPSNGAVEGVINLKSLKDQVTQHDELDVLNGIAYKGEKNILYVTGKNWDKLFKIEIVKN